MFKSTTLREFIGVSLLGTTGALLLFGYDFIMPLAHHDRNAELALLAAIFGAFTISVWISFILLADPVKGDPLLRRTLHLIFGLAAFLIGLGAYAYRT